jgi:hypothetical protein
MLLSLLRRAPSTSSRMVQPKKCVFPPFLSLSGPFNPQSLKLAAQVLEHSTYLQVRLRASLSASSIPAHILSLPARFQQRQTSTAQPPTPIIPLLTPYARALSAHLLAHGLNARPISWPTVPKGMDRVRVCLHAGNTRAEIDALVSASVAWAVGIAQAERAGPEGDQPRVEGGGGGMDPNVGSFLRSKL